MAGRPIKKLTCAQPVKFRVIPENEIPRVSTRGFLSKKKSTGYAGGGGGQGKGFSSSKRQYTKKLRCAKLNVRLATVHKKSTQEDVLMKNQENDTFSLAQGK